MAPARSLHNTLTRRLHLLVLLLAPIPLGVLVWTALGDYQRQLTTETDHRLAVRAKDAGLDVFRRLEGLEADLRLLGAGFDDTNQVRALPVPVPMVGRFRRLVVGGPGAAGPGTDYGLPRLDGEQVRRLLDGKPLFMVNGGGAPEPWLLVPLARPGGAILWAEVDPSWLWPAANAASETGQDWLLLDAKSSRPLAASGDPPRLLLDALGHSRLGAAGGFEWRTDGGEARRARFWSLPLGFELGYPGLAALVSEPDALAESVSDLRRNLLLVAVATLLGAWVIGLVRLRRDLKPLSVLAEGTERLADGDFATRVDIRGPIDLERLGDAFNSMASRIQRQFFLLDTGRAVALSALAPVPRDEEVAATFVERIADLVPGSDVVVVLHRSGDAALSLLRRAGVETVERTAVPEGEAAKLERSLSGEQWADLDETASFLRPVLSGRRALWRQLRFGDRLLASVGVLRSGSEAEAEVGMALVRDLSEQLALALFRVQLMADLERANWGALTALARAVDAKSPWTQGHSSRVAEIAVVLAQELGWSEDVVRVVRRGCLLHDVGKIGVPRAVLDKETRLTTEEMELLRTHVEKGVRIVEPVEGLSEVLPIVAQHHERLDGSGYPKGLRGPEIHVQALLVAVADVFEALTAPRPYRQALSAEAAESYLVRNVDELFDRRSVDALVAARARGALDDLLAPSAISA
jgi:putative nucleotidyltransferase with HDIG domain